MSKIKDYILQQEENDILIVKKHISEIKKSDYIDPEISEFIRTILPDEYSQYFYFYRKKRIYCNSIEDYILHLSYISQTEYDAFHIPTTFRGVKSKGENALHKKCIFIDIDETSIDLNQPDKKIIDDLFHHFPEMEKIKPTYIIKSGHGIHLYYTTKEIYDMKNPIDIDKWLLLMREYITYFGGDTKCTDIPRIMRLPNSYNCKDGHKKEVKIIYKSGSIYNFGELMELDNKKDPEEYWQQENKKKAEKSAATREANGTKAGRKKKETTAPEPELLPQPPQEEAVNKGDELSPLPVIIEEPETNTRNFHLFDDIENDEWEYDDEQFFYDCENIPQNEYDNTTQAEYDYYNHYEEYTRPTKPIKYTQNERKRLVIEDAVKWYGMRKGNIQGSREEFVFIISNFMKWQGNTQDETEYFLMRFFGGSVFEEEALIQINNVFRNGKIYLLSNRWIAQKLRYTPEETKHLKLIYNEEERLQARKANNKRTAKRQKEKRGFDAKKQHQIETIKQNPDKTNKELAEMLKTSIRTIQRLRKNIE